MAEKQAATLPEDLQIATFKPLAYFDKYMDCIRVLTHDRSVTEHRINEYFTVYESNVVDEFSPRYVGFTIKGVTHMFNEAEIPLDGSYKLAELIDRLVKHRPGSTLSATLQLIFSQHKATGDLPVEFGERAVAA